MKFEVIPFAEVERTKAQALKVLEEAAECVEKWKEFNAHRSFLDDERPDALAAWLDECADVAQALANLLAAEDIGDGDFAFALKCCREKNEARGRRYADG